MVDKIGFVKKFAGKEYQVATNHRYKDDAYKEARRWRDAGYQTKIFFNKKNFGAFTPGN